MWVLLLSLLWSLVEVHSQLTFPYVYFMYQTLSNHSYVYLSEVGDYYCGVQCVTDLSTCCRGADGPHRGDWYFPNGTRLPFSGDGDGIYEQRETAGVDIRRRNNANSPVGIYRCDIPTIAVHDDDTSVRDAPVYVGLYTASGGNHLVVISCCVCFPFFKANVYYEQQSYIYDCHNCCRRC